MLEKYKQNLKVIGKDVFSYNTKVGEINFEAGSLKKLGWWSVTTSKHINYVAKEFNLIIIE